MFKLQARCALFLVLITLGFAAPPAEAQDVDRFEGYLAFSYANIRLDSETTNFSPTSRNFYGLQLGGKLNFNKHIGIMLLDMGIQWGGTNIKALTGTQFKTNTRLEAWQVLWGPEFTYRNKKADLFARTLVGLNRTALLLQFTNTSAELDSSTHFALGAGGGVDFPLTEALGLRVGADYVPSRVNGNWENDFRNYVGIVLRH